MRQDNYPTRKGDTYEIIRPQKNLTTIQIEKFKNDGYLVIENFYSQLSDITETCESIFNGKIECYKSIEPNANFIRSALAVHNIEGIRNALSPKLINTVKCILGNSIYIHQSRINYKAGKDANGWSWHSDFETWHSKDGMPNMDCLTAFIAIDNNTKENGCIQFIPKSHKLFISCPKVGNVKPEDEFKEQKEGVPSDKIINEVCRELNTKPIYIECNAGDLVLFHCNLLHKSDGNNTNKKRTNLYFVFNSLHNALQQPFNDIVHRPEEMGSTKIELL
jgi:ectoine hydroxylase